MEIAGFVSYSVVIIVDWRCIQPFPNFSIFQYNWQAKSELSGLRINLEKFAAGRTTRFIFGFSPQAAAAAKIEHDDDGGWLMMTTDDGTKGRDDFFNRKWESSRRFNRKTDIFAKIKQRNTHLVFILLNTALLLADHTGPHCRSCPSVPQWPHVCWFSIYLLFYFLCTNMENWSPMVRNSTFWNNLKQVLQSLQKFLR